MTETTSVVEAEASAFRAPGSVADKIEKARLELLDLSTRNRLLHTPRSGRAKTIEVVGELSEAMFKTLVLDGKRLTFAPGRVDPAESELADGDAVSTDAPGPEFVEQPEVELDEHGRQLAHWDSQLGTRMTSSGLQKRLVDLYIDAKTVEEEQGVNILYLAIGYLRWRATSKQDQERFAPLVLVPVRLERSNAGEKFHLKWSGEDVQTNLSLQLYMKREFALKLPSIGDVENFDITRYLQEVADLVSERPVWGVEKDDAVLGLFSFAKFMMYRDLDASEWAGVGGFNALPSLRGVVSEGFPGTELTSDEAAIDDLMSPAQTLHVVDCDSSQSLVVFDVQNGHSILVQGPPGTGKSQTITNIIAAAIADQKKVLFVAEKMAALEVVWRRLDHIGLGVACLELHSHKANKRSLLHELRNTWQLGAPKFQDGRVIVEQLTKRRDELNAHAARLHQVLEPSGLSPFDVYGHLVRLRREGHATRRIELEQPTRWRPHEKMAREQLLLDLAQRIRGMGLPTRHAWNGVGITDLTPNDRERLILAVSTQSGQLALWRRRADAFLGAFDLPAAGHFSDVATGISRAELLIAAPAIGKEALIASIWSEQGAVDTLIEALSDAQCLRSQCHDVAHPEALGGDWAATRDALTGLAPQFTVGGELATLASLRPLIERLLPDATRLAQLLGEQGTLTLDSAAHLAAVGEHASSVPAIEREALVAHIWDRGVDTIEELIEAVEHVQHAKQGLAPVFRDAAWSKDWEGARGHIATMGSSWLRWFNGQWRRANREVRSQLFNPKLPALGMLDQLDTLMAAQTAQRKIIERDAQGREAFGTQWERERSQSSFMRGVVAWMRALRPLGSGVREKLADVSDRQLASELAARISPLLDDVRQRLTPISEALIAAERRPWGEETVLRRVPLTQLREQTSASAKAYAQAALLAERDTLLVDGAIANIALIERTQQALAGLQGKNLQARAAFGDLWSDIDTDLALVHAAAGWMHEHPELHGLAARIDDPARALSEGMRVDEEATGLVRTLHALFSSLKFAGNDLVASQPRDAALSALSELLAWWEGDSEGLPQWVAYQARANQGIEHGMGDLIARMATGEVPADEAVGAFELAYFEAVLAAMTKRDPALSQFDGEQQTQTVLHFGQLDRDRMQLARHQVLTTHHARIPKRGGATGPTGQLLGEMEKKRGQMAIRQLMTKCAPAIQALKPVFMMSPLSVAQFLPPGALDFDLLVIDEASQVQPVDALGAIARAKQLVIVGDERQLPPTRFFAKVVGEADEKEESDETQAADVESVLGLCRARGLPERMLRWHYRSRHQSLIAVSNSQFYSNRLLIVPSPYTSEAGLGLRFHHLPDAVYDRGNTRTNPGEAKVVARAMIQHAIEHPQLTLGVATFSTQQRRAIFDELEILRRQHPETEGFFTAHPEEPWFVKSLENIQGDERDVILISVGYGRDAQRHLTMNFGPLGKDGGERRLNVLISRAKSRCEVFSSITDEDIDLERTRAKGTVAFKLFLHYARTGRLSIVQEEEQEEEGRRVFEEEVAAALRARGYELHTRVGIAGLFVDIAVSNPKRPGRYVLGIECDGAWYRDAKSARDRERLREAALRDKGWLIYRIWVGDWFQRPKTELDRLVSAIDRALEHSEEEEQQPKGPSRPVPVEVASVERGEFVEVGLINAEEDADSTPYEEASFKVPSRQYELHLVPPEVMADIVRDIVAIEGPIHRAELVARVRDLWGLGRAGSRIQATVDAGIQYALRDTAIERSHHDFLSLPGQTVLARDRSEVASPTLRRPDYLPPQEIDTAIVDIVAVNLGATVGELVLRVSRQLGYRSTSAQLRAVIEDRVVSVVKAGKVNEVNGMICPA
jgi:very-short-patch-repair endonuclease